MTPDLIIFDCDGVLVDTEHLVNDILAESLTKHGLPMTADQTYTLFTGGTMIGVEAEARSKGADLPVDWIDTIYAAMFARIEAGVDVIDGVLEIIEVAETRGIHMAIASNGPMEKMRRSLGPSGLWDRFGSRIYSREHHKPKPAPDMLIHAMKIAAVEPEKTVMIDDSASGCMAAKNAGVRCLGYAAEGQADRLENVGAEPCLTMTDVARKLGF